MVDSSFDIPRRIPVMTLRGVVLLPSAMMPLRIFEPRYRKMLDEVLSGDRMFGIVREREDVGQDEVELELSHEVGTVGLVRISKKHDDGTSFVLLQGLHRVRILSILEESPYRILEVEPLETLAEESFSALRMELFEAFRRNVELEGLVTEEILEMLSPIEDGGALVDLAAHHLCREVDVKQDLLEEPSLCERANILLRLLEVENERLTFLKQSFEGQGQEDMDSD